jgi:ABC-type antimicrobial peptide transport system permease subunit
MAADILAAFGLLAITLASVGLYSVMAYSVMRRTREIGIRIAIGARPEMVVRQVLGKSMRLAAAGLALGSAASAVLMRFVASQVKDVSPYDGWTFSAVALLLTTVALAAALAPARRAARIDPLTALRCD